ncbi:MAG: CRISPR-associated endonuclease Cas2 [Dehalococcoidia bacterium]
MMVLVTYDVNTESSAGRRRLRRVAQVCLNFGQRVQYSVFECLVSEADFVRLQSRLQKEMDSGVDSIRLYVLDDTARRQIKHFGAGKPRDLDEPLVV